MKKSILFLLSIMSVSSCYTVETDKDMLMEATRITASPSVLEFRPVAEEKSVSVIVNPLSKKDMSWTYEDPELPWLQISKELIAGQSTGEIMENALVVKADANNAYSRKTSIVVTAEDGTVLEIPVRQQGIYADAYVSVDREHVEFTAENVIPAEVVFESNMDDVFSIQGEEGSDWISWAEPARLEGDGNRYKVTFTAQEWNDKDNERKTSVKIVAGTPQTSEASAVITFTQLPQDLYCYAYGPSLPDFSSQDSAVRMYKVNDGTYKLDAYFADSNGLVLYTTDNDYYALSKDNTLHKLDSASGETPDFTGCIDVDGMRTLTVNLNDLTWSMERITVKNCLPDEKVADYPTKAFVARDGSMKIWMTKSLAWDGGDISPKLGSMMAYEAAKASGGYASSDLLPQSLNDPNFNPDYETEENGGKLKGSNEHGRIYCYSEILTGSPRGGIDSQINQTLPSGWQAGNDIVDAVGNTIHLEYVTYPVSFSGDNKADELAHPMLSMQIQGICPYGWHIANAADHLDLIYAMSQASKDGKSYPVDENNVTYKQFTVSKKGIDNAACWYRNHTYWTGDNISDGADDFGFNLYPLGFRYLKQGYQMAGLRYQTWVPLYYNEKSLNRINVVINDHSSKYTEMSKVDNGNAILPFRCVKNYK